MKLVIELTDDEMYQVIKDGMWCRNELWYNALKNGTPLPKDHGRLIDADKLYDDYEINSYDWEDTIEYAPTVIEASGKGKE